MQIDLDYDELAEIRLSVAQRINQPGIQSTDMYMLLKILEKVSKAMTALNEIRAKT